MTRVVWGVIVAVFLVMAVAGPAKMIKEHSDNAGSKTSTVAAPASGTGYGGGGGGGGGAKPEVHMRGLKFAPGTLQVARGTTVVFKNDDTAPHTVTEDGGGTVDSGVLSPGKSFTLTVNSTLKYHCDIHPQMTATIELKG